MKLILSILFYFYLSSSLLASYPMIKAADKSLPKCEVKNNNITTKNKCYGTVEDYKGTGYTYIGEFDNQQSNGNGMIFNNQAKYYGQFKNGELHGYGRFEIPSKNYFYVGDMYKNNRTGFGVDVDQFNSKYIGSYKDNARHGEGISIFSDNGDTFKSEWDFNQPIEEKYQRINFLEYDSGIGFKFNHIAHLNLMSKKSYNEMIEQLPNWQQGLAKRPHIERVVFWDTNALNYIEEEINFNRLTIEYDFIDEEEAEALFNDERVYTDIYDEKYRFLLVNLSDIYENTIAYNIIIQVNERYYTISYVAPYNNEFEQKNIEVNFYLFFLSWEFDVPEKG